MSTISRRSALTAGAAALATGAAAVPAAMAKPVEPDPIYAAIEAHKVALARFLAVCNANMRNTRDHSLEEVDRLCGEEAMLARNLIRTVPRTIGGAADLIRHVVECETSGRIEIYTLIMEGGRDNAVNVLLATLGTALDKIAAVQSR
jgi:hypothetical protein